MVADAVQGGRASLDYGSIAFTYPDRPQGVNLASHPLMNIWGIVFLNLSFCELLLQVFVYESQGLQFFCV